MTAPGAPAVKRDAPSSEDSGDWLADIFDSVDDEVIGNLPPGASLSLPAEAIAALEASGGEGSGVADGSSQAATAAKKRGRDAAGEPRGSAKVKKSAREKRRRDALNDRFMGLSALLDPGSGEELKTDKATIVTEAARVIKSLREELSTLTASLEEAVNSNAEMAKERESLIQDKIKLEHQLHHFVSSMPFASPMYAPGCGPPAPGAPGAALVPAGRVAQADAAKPGQPAMVPMMWAFPPLVVQSTTAEEDAKLRAPVA